MTAIPETNRRRGAPETNRRRGAPRGNRNALKSGRYTAEAKAERRRTRLLLRQLRAGLAYARSVIRARDAAARLDKIFKNRKTIPARREPASTTTCSVVIIRKSAATPGPIPPGARGNICEMDTISEKASA